MSAGYLTASHWLVAVPNELGSAKATADRFASAISSRGSGAEVTPWEVPAMKVGTLDSLMSLADELGKADGYIEGVARKAERTVVDAFSASSTSSSKDDGSIASAPASSASSSIPALRVGSLPVADYVKRFSWDREMLDPQELLPDLVRRILAKTEGLDAELRSMSLAYSEKRTALTALERKRAGNLMVCGLEEVVTSAALEAAGAELVPPDSEYLASLLLVVPKAGEEAFLASYETQLDGQAVPLGGETNRDAVKGSPVVPRSARRIAEDKDGYVLYAVTILKKFEASFRQACKERRYTVRDFAFDPQAAAAAAANAAALEVEVASNLNALKAASQRFYGDAIVLWLHLKAVRLFVESVLRYGLPVNFAALLVHNYTAASAPSNGGKAGAPTASQGKKTLEGLMAGWRSASGAAGGFLDAHYGDVTSGKKGAGSSGADVVIPGVTDSAGAGGPAFPFVFTDLDVKS